MSIGTRIKRGVFGSLLMLSQNRPVFTADYYALDGGSGNVASFIDWNDPTHLLVQGNPSNQVAAPAAHANFGGKLCVNFSSLTQSYLSNQPSTRFSYAHDGSGILSWAVFSETTTSGFATQGLTTCDLVGPTNGSGISLFHQNPGGYRAVVSNGAAYILNTTAAGGVAVGPTYAYVKFQRDVAPQCAVNKKGTQVGTASLSGVPSSGAPKTSLILGTVIGNNAVSGLFRACGYAPCLGDQGEAALRAYIQADTGITP